MTTVLIIVGVVIVLVILYKIFKMIMSLLMMAVFAAIAYFTNPGIEQHRKAVEVKAAKFSMEIKSSSITVEDYKLFSITKVGDSRKVVGVGMFRIVWIFGNPKDWTADQSTVVLLITHKGYVFVSCR